MPSKKFPQTGKLLLLFAALITVLILISPAVELLLVVQDRQAVIAQAERFGIWGPTALAAAILLQLVIAVIPGHFLGVAAGYLYGFGYGFLLSWVTVVLGGQALFYLTRIYGKPFAYRLAS
ncbi:MAG: hypothetical protein OEV06_12890, partial [Anaerolineae bacterium]|nr:hypothetical protein [Anaerolineae bacterium]